MAHQPAPVAVLPRPEPTQSCVRCGAVVPLGTSMCEDCNPLGLKAPASSQAHGTIFLAIVISVALLAVAGRLAVAGVGPFDATIARVEPAATGLSITITVTNKGTSRGAPTCRVFDPDQVDSPLAYLLSPQIDPGTTVSFSRQTSELGTQVVPLQAACSSP